MSGSARLPVVPRPAPDERLSSWLVRLARLYAMPVDVFLDHLGLGGRTIVDLEWRLSAGEGALIARWTGMPVENVLALTFRNIVPKARMMIAHKDRHCCPQCPPDVHRKATAFPWTFRCPVHGTRYATSTGAELETLFGRTRLTELDGYVSLGAARLSAWVEGEEGDVPTSAMMLDFLTTRHRQSSPPSLAEQPRMSLQARRDHHAFLTRPIARQALLVAVPEYDWVAPVLAKPVRPGLLCMARGSLLKAYGLAAGIGRLTQSPVETAIAVFLASDMHGEGRLREAVRQWPLSLRRRIWARLWRARVAEKDREAAEKTANRSQSHKLRFIRSHY